MPCSGWWNQGGYSKTDSKTNRKKSSFRTVDESKHRSSLHLLSDTRLSGVGEEPGLLGFTVDKCSPRFGCRARGCGACTEAGAGALRCTPLRDSPLPLPSPPPASRALFGLVLLSTAAFGSSTIAELVYRKVNFRSSQDLLSFFQTWYADKPYPVEIKQI